MLCEFFLYSSYWIIHIDTVFKNIPFHYVLTLDIVLTLNYVLTLDIPVLNSRTYCLPFCMQEFASADPKLPIHPSRYLSLHTTGLFSMSDLIEIKNVRLVWHSDHSLGTLPSVFTSPPCGQHLIYTTPLSQVCSMQSKTFMKEIKKTWGKIEERQRERERERVEWKREGEHRYWVMLMKVVGLGFLCSPLS